MSTAEEAVQFFSFELIVRTIHIFYRGSQLPAFHYSQASFFTAVTPMTGMYSQQASCTPNSLH
jgi:hypothetical protein